MPPEVQDAIAAGQEMLDKVKKKKEEFDATIGEAQKKLDELNEKYLGRSKKFIEEKREEFTKELEAKKEIVEKDEFDKGERAKLNLGHTVGHAVESLSGYKHSHGLCVAKGIGKIIDISCKYYGYDDNKKQEFINLLSAVPFDLNIEYSTKEIQDKILIDKKSCNDGVNIVLIKDVGKTEIVKFTQFELENVLK